MSIDLLRCHVTTQVRSRDQPRTYVSSTIQIHLFLLVDCAFDMSQVQNTNTNSLDAFEEWSPETFARMNELANQVESKRLNRQLQVDGDGELQQTQKLTTVKTIEEQREYNRLKSKRSREAKKRAIHEEREMKQAKIEQLESELAAIKTQPSAHLSIMLPNAGPSNIPLTFCKVQRHIKQQFESFSRNVLPVPPRVHAFGEWVDGIIAQLSFESGKSVLIGRIFIVGDQNTDQCRAYVQPGFVSVPMPLSSSTFNFLSIEWVPCENVADGTKIPHQQIVEHLYAQSKFQPCSKIVTNYFPTFF